MAARASRRRAAPTLALLALPAGARGLAGSAPLSFVRVVAPAPNRFELQTLSVSVELGAAPAAGQVVEMIGTVHSRAPAAGQVVEMIGTVHIAESSYYLALLQDASAVDRSLCELVVPEACLEADGELGLLRLRERIAPSDEQRRLAAQLGLTHQLDGLPYGADGRFSCIADLPAERLAPSSNAGGSALSEVLRTIRRGAMRGAALGASRARRGPPAWQQALRSAAWLVPCPELSLLVLDWAWSRTRPQLSALLQPLGRAIGTLDLRSARRLAFAQLLLSSSAEGGGATGVVFGGGGIGARVELRTQQRNDAALGALELALAAPSRAERLALFYGPSHLEGPNGLVAALLSRPGARIVDASWRTAFAAELDPRSAEGRGAERFLLPVFLAASGLDWWSTLSELLESGVELGQWSDDALSLALYVLRHGLLYWSLSKWALDWSGRFED